MCREVIVEYYGHRPITTPASNATDWSTLLTRVLTRTCELRWAVILATSFVGRWDHGPSGQMGTAGFWPDILRKLYRSGWRRCFQLSITAEWHCMCCLRQSVPCADQLLEPHICISICVDEKALIDTADGYRCISMAQGSTHTFASAFHDAPRGVTHELFYAPVRHPPGLVSTVIGLRQMELPHDEGSCNLCTHSLRLVFTFVKIAATLCVPLGRSIPPSDIALN